MHITKLTVDNFMRVVAVSIEPNGRVVTLSGRNRQGKTSVLNALWVALAGAAVAPPDPIRHGAERAVIKLEMGEVVVTRTFSEGKRGPTTKLQVEQADGVPIRSPQTFLDNLIGELSFDPMEFQRMNPADQVRTLRTFVSEVDFDAIDAQNAADYASRRDINRREKELRAAAEQITLPDDAPIVSTDLRALTDELENAGQQNADIDLRRGNRERMAKEVERLLSEAGEIEQEIERLKSKADRMRSDASEKKNLLVNAAELPATIDTSAIRKKLDQANEQNELFERRRRREQIIKDADELSTQSEALTKAIESRKQQVADEVAKSALPIEGIGFGDGMITMNGIPLDQASDAEQREISVAIAMALNPELRVIRIRDASLLDSEAKADIARMADSHDFQVWMECVDESGKVGFVIEDGRVQQQATQSEPPVGVAKNDDRAAEEYI